jgi:peptidoglycan/xylan/chitin deacetylase (PgdA/CDA1 family)
MITRSVAIGCAAVAGVSAAGFLNYAVRGRSAQFFGPSVYQGCSSRRSIALTFDDGPSPKSFELIEYLARWNIRATFFQCGLNILRHPDIARQIYATGHEIGNHTYSHLLLRPKLGYKPRINSGKTVARQFSLAQEIIVGEVGVKPALLRAPYGMRWFGMREMQQELGLLGVMWTVIGHDWEWQASPIADLVLSKASPGGIICLHDGRDIQPNPDISEMLKALKVIVPRLVDQGYSFETVSELLTP